MYLNYTADLIATDYRATSYLKSFRHIFHNTWHSYLMYNNESLIASPDSYEPHNEMSFFKTLISLGNICVSRYLESVGPTL